MLSAQVAPTALAPTTVTFSALMREKMSRFWRRNKDNSFRFSDLAFWVFLELSYICGLVQLLNQLK
jgi:hypothetical protein